MSEAPPTEDEIARIAALRSLNVLDTEEEERFDRITRLGARLFDAPIVLVSLVDVNRQWFKSCRGLPMRETPRSMSFCAHAIHRDNALVIPDALRDERFVDNPLVTGEPHIRFYAGYPLKAPTGHNVGTLCVIDTRPRTMSAADLDSLRDLAYLTEVELRESDLHQALEIKRENDERRALEYGAASILGRTSTLEEAAVGLLQTMCEHAGWDLAAMWLVDPEANVLRWYTDWQAPSFEAPRFVKASRALVLTPGQGLPGRVWTSGRPEHLDDVGGDSRFLRVGEAAIEGLHGALALPVQADAATLGVLEFYSRDILRTRPDLIRVMAPIASDLGQFIERKRIEEQLRAQLSFTQAVTSSLGEGVYVLDREGSLTFMNPAAEQLLGWKECELHGRDMHEAVHFQRADGTARPRQECVLLDVLQSGQTVQVAEDFFTRKDGSMIPVAYVSCPIVDDGMEVTGAVLAFHDITARKRAEENLKRQAAELRGQAELLDLAHDAILVRRLKTSTIAFWNQGAERMYGWSKAEAEGRTSHELLRTQFPWPLEQIEAELVDSGHWEGELIHTRRDGSRLTIASRWALQRDVDGHPMATLEINSDITERTRAERRLQETHAQLQLEYQNADSARGEAHAVLDAASDAMILVAPDQVFRSVNRRFEEMFGIDSARVLGRAFADLQDDVERVFVDVESFRTLVARSAANSKDVFTDVVAQKWPQQRELYLYSTPVRTGDNLHVGRLYVFRDITPEREADRLKTEFVSMVSHELRTPLTSIKGYVDLLLEGEVGDVSEEQQEFLTIVKNNADRLVALVNDLLDMSRIEAGKVQLNVGTLDLGLLLRGVVDSLRPQIESKQQRLTVDVPEKLPPVIGDTDRVIQIVTNLVSNAYKYTPPMGSIRLNAHVQGDVIRVDVNDTGVGLSADELKQIFSRFFRARNRATQEAGGTGLGLTITRSLVELHDGTMTVTSTPGEGSTFSFTLPIAESVGAQSGDTGIVPAGGTILVVDDELEIADLIRRYLERAGYGVLVAHTGKDAIAAAREWQPDLITLDIKLPDVDGFTVLKWLKSDRQTAAIPVMMLSILDDTGQGRLLGAVGYLTKPIQEAALLEHIGHVLHGDHRARSVLVADDDSDVRETIGQALRQAGFQIIEASNGAEALTLAVQHRPGLILMSFALPDMDGIAALRHIRGYEVLRDLPIIIMTPNPGLAEESESAEKALGSRMLLSKPCTPEELALAIAEGRTDVGDR